MSKWLEYVTDASTGNVVVWKCDECGEEVETQWNFCPICGDPKTSKAKSINTLVKALETEHRKLKEMQSKVGTNLAEVDTREVRGYSIDANALMEKVAEEYGERARDRLYSIIRYLPPAQPQRTGKWIKKHRHYGGFRSYTGFDAMGEQHTVTVDERTEYDDLYCSECGARSADNFLNFCPNCGAKMEGDAE